MHYAVKPFTFYILEIFIMGLKSPKKKSSARAYGRVGDEPSDRKGTK